jgi:hypothetical protein
MSKFYITEKSEIISKLATLSQVSISEDGWIHYYCDEKNDEEWKLTSYRTGTGAEHLILKKLPEPTIEEAINIALNSRNSNDIAGAIFDLLTREKNQQVDFRLLLLQKLKSYLKEDPAFDSERVKLIIQQCELTEARNRRTIIGKHFTEVEKDAAYFYTIAQEAKSILKSFAAS